MNTSRTVDERAIISSIGYCGLICKICHFSNECGGCKSNDNRCSKYLSEAGCFQYDCCEKKGIMGCWECTEFPCAEDMYSESASPKVKAFTICIRENGIEKLAVYIRRALDQGLDITLGGDLDHKTENEILAILRRED